MIEPLLDALGRRWLHRQCPPELTAPRALRIADQLPYDSVYDPGPGQPLVVVLDDEGLGTVWRLPLQDPETWAPDAMDKTATRIARALLEVDAPDALLQLRYVVRPAFGSPFDVPEPTTGPELVRAERSAHLERWAQGGTLGDRSSFRTLQRQLFLTLRLEPPTDRPRWLSGPTDPTVAVVRAHEAFQARVTRLLAAAGDLSHALTTQRLVPEPCDADTILALLRAPWASQSAWQTDPALRRPLDPTTRLADQVAKNAVRLSPRGLQVGEDSKEVLTWLGLPSQLSVGAMASLLSLDLPVEATLTLRPKVPTFDLGWKRIQADAPLPSAKRRAQRQDLDWVDELRENHGETLVGVSLTLVVTSEGTALEDLPTRGLGRAVERALREDGLDVAVVEDVAPLLFLRSQPLAIKAVDVPRLGLERRVLAPSVLAGLLPLWGGFEGLATTSDEAVLLAHSRAGDPIGLSLDAAETAPHVAVLGTTGSGKSALVGSLVLGLAAQDPRTRVFVVDSLASLTNAGALLGEHGGGFTLVQPPHHHPPVWAGRPTTDRLRLFVELLRAAMRLNDANTDARWTAEHNALLEHGIQQAYIARDREASTALGLDTALFTEAPPARQRPTLRLRDVVDQFAEGTARLGLPSALASDLTSMLRPCLGSGGYADFFDRPGVEPPEERTPAMTLFDLGQLTDPGLRSLLTALCVSEVFRQMLRPENRGHPAVLVIEEIGVTLREPAMAQFVTESWVRLRKAGVRCIGVGNRVQDFQTSEAGRAIWALSPNHVISALPTAERRAAQSGAWPLVTDPIQAEVLASLQIVRGSISEYLWDVVDHRSGTFAMLPSPIDYWAANTHPAEGANFRVAMEALGSAKAALQWLAARFPNGVRDPLGHIRPLTPDELPKPERDARPSEERRP